MERRDNLKCHNQRGKDVHEKELKQRKDVLILSKIVEDCSRTFLFCMLLGRQLSHLIFYERVIDVQGYQGLDYKRGIQS